MITVEKALQIVNSFAKDFGVEKVPLQKALNRILRKSILADRDFPPFHRVTMDGIAIEYKSFESGQRSYKVEGIGAAGAPLQKLKDSNNCLEVMTGAMLPKSTDTVIRYEDVSINNGIATITSNQLKKGQNIHYQGSDKQKGEQIIEEGTVLSPAEIGVCATVGESEILVAKLPNVLIISTGDELVDVHETPKPHQIRKSNIWQIQSILHQLGIEAQTAHLVDQKEAIISQLKEYLKSYDVLIFSGAVSKGKFDFLPEALQEVGVKKHFHKVLQRPGKPFWFGTTDLGNTIFAFPGNPVSTFACTQFYFKNWLNKSLGIKNQKLQYAELAEDLNFNPDLTYFLQVKLENTAEGKNLAYPITGNGSGDLANLVYADAFIVIPQGKTLFKKGETYPIIPFR
jgi:molybdopterin molybdotransferase